MDIDPLGGEDWEPIKYDFGLLFAPESCPRRARSLS